MLIKASHKRLLVGYRKSDWQEIFYEPNPSRIEKANELRPPVPLFCYSATADVESNKNPYAEEINWLPQYDPANFEAQVKAQKIMQHWFMFRCWQYMEGATAQQLAQNQFDRPNYVRWQIWKKAADAKKKRTKSGKPPGEKRSAEGLNDEDNDDNFNDLSSVVSFDKNRTTMNGHAGQPFAKKRQTQHGDHDAGLGSFGGGFFNGDLGAFADGLDG